MQISESHCGPAVVQMLLSNLGIEVSQEAIAEAGGATDLIEMNGMRVDQLALATHRLGSQIRFYYKDHATIDEIVEVVNDYHYPVGVEWQGLFEDETEIKANTPISNSVVQAGLATKSESDDNDYGHYSLVIRADRRKRILLIADPYKDYFSQARTFSFEEFDRRWYDYNEFPDPVAGKSVLLEDDHLFFLIVRRNVKFPHRMKMKAFSF